MFVKSQIQQIEYIYKDRAGEQAEEPWLMSAGSLRCQHQQSRSSKCQLIPVLWVQHIVLVMEKGCLVKQRG
jgi:hypothetical protein